jgi:hypothetical protein
LDANPFMVDLQILDDFGTQVLGPMLENYAFNITLAITSNACAFASLPVQHDDGDESDMHVIDLTRGVDVCISFA